MYLQPVAEHTLYLLNFRLYMLKKTEKEEGSVLEVIIWPEPYCYAKTPEENKQRTEFPFTAEGVEQAADWLNEQYVQQKSLWELSKKF